MVVISTYPSAGGKAYLDDSIIVRFDEPIEGSYASDSYFLLYRTSPDGQQYYSQVQRTVSQNDIEVIIKPSTNLDPASAYVLIVVGGSNGVQSTTGSKLASNFTLSFSVENAFSPSAPVTTTIPATAENVLVDGDIVTGYALDETQPSNDVFVSPYDASHTMVISTFPSSYAIGVGEIDSISLTCNGTVVSGSVPEGAVAIGVYTLPIDPDPFSRLNVPFSVVYSGNTFSIELSEPIDMQNKEMVITIQPGFITVDGKTPDPVGYEIRFIGTLSPFYATPDYIRRKFSLFGIAEFPLKLYDLVKIIHDKSLMVASIIGAGVTSEMLPTLSELITCLILKDMFVIGYATGGRLKSRELLATRVVYDNASLKDTRDAIDDCINSSLDSIGVNEIKTAIKSRVWLPRESKTYGIYR